MNSKMTLIYWKGEKFWLGKLLEHPEIMTQGETFEELEENIKDAYFWQNTSESTWVCNNGLHEQNAQQSHLS